MAAGPQWRRSWRSGPRTTAIWPAPAAPGRRPSGVDTATSVTLAGSAAPNANRSRTRSSPDHTRTHARRPRSSRSTAKTVAARSPGGGEGRGSRVVKASQSSGSPAPVTAEPHRTGVSAPASSPRRSAARAAAELTGRSEAQSSSTRSSPSASAITTLSRVNGTAVTRASRAPAPSTCVSGTTDGVRRRRTWSRTSSTSAPERSTLSTNRRVWHADPLERPPDHHRLRLDAFHRGQHEDGRVKDTEGALDLGDEVGVPGGVERVDDHVAERERRHRGPDGDAATTFDVERVGTGRSGVDAAGRIEGACLEQQALSQAGLAGVNMGDYAEVEGGRGRGHKAAPRLDGSRSGAW